METLIKQLEANLEELKIEYAQYIVDRNEVEDIKEAIERIESLYFEWTSEDTAFDIWNYRGFQDAIQEIKQLNK